MFHLRKKMKVTGIVLVSGSIRYGKNINKNLEILKDKNVLLYSVLAFDQNNKMDDIILVVKKDEKEVFQNIKITFDGDLKILKSYL